MIKLVDNGLDKAHFVLLTEEDFRQRMKWGRQAHTLDEWMLILMEEVGELSKAVLEGKDKHAVVREASQVATLGLKIAVMADEQLEEKE